MKIYKLRNKKTGLYSDGGRYANVNFNENGKIWSSLKEIKAFLKYFIRDSKNCEKSNIDSENKMWKLAYDRKNKPQGTLESKLKVFNPKPDIEYLPKEWEVVKFEQKEIDMLSVNDLLK